jgi:hypothetical protein
MFDAGLKFVTMTDTVRAIIWDHVMRYVSRHYRSGDPKYSAASLLSDLEELERQLGRFTDGGYVPGDPRWVQDALEGAQRSEPKLAQAVAYASFTIRFHDQLLATDGMQLRIDYVCRMALAFIEQLDRDVYAALGAREEPAFVAGDTPSDKHTYREIFREALETALAEAA